MKDAMTWWWRVIGGLVFALFVSGAHAAPAHCSYGYQDSSCIAPQYRAAETPPTCSSGPGWTTVSGAVWIGSRFTQPQCNYQAPPTCSTGPGWVTSAPAGWNGSSWSAPQCSYQSPPSCQPGYDEVSAPGWNGSAWVGLGCLPRAPSVPQQESACAGMNPYTNFVGQFPRGGPVYSLYPPGDFPFNPAGTMTGAASFTNVYTPLVNSAGTLAPYTSCWGSNVVTPGSMHGSSDGSLYDVYVSVGYQSDPYGGNDVAAASICWTQHGTTNVTYMTVIGLMKNPGTCH